MTTKINMRTLECVECSTVFEGYWNRKRCDPCRDNAVRKTGRLYARKWRYEHPDHIPILKQRNLAYRTNNPRKTMWLNAKRRARKDMLPFTITEDDIILPEPMICPILNIPMKFKLGTEKKGHTPTSPSLDRLDPAKGYVPDNICVISLKANRMKQDCTVEDFKRLIQYVENGGKIN